MRRISEWLKIVFAEKINVFIKGCLGGGILFGTFLFRDNVHDIPFWMLALTYFVKLLAVIVSALASGYFTVLGNDLVVLTKQKWKKCRAKRKVNQIRKKKAA